MKNIGFKAFKLSWIAIYLKPKMIINEKSHPIGWL
jgi:hypothetical protein